MKCPNLEDWLAALDDEEAGAPQGAHPDCATCADTEREARALLRGLHCAVKRSPRSDEAFVAAVLEARAANATAAAAPLVPALLPRRPASRKIRWLAWGAAPLAAAAILIVAMRLQPQLPEDSPVARGTPGSGPWCEVAAVGDGGLQFLGDGDHLPARAALAFRVRHDGPDDAWLGVVAITETGQVAWYHPAFESTEDDPRTIRLTPSAKARMLPDRVSLPLGGGKVKLLCWKAEHAWSVRQADALVESAVAAARANPTAIDRVPELGGDQTGVRLWFEPEQ